jgi:hypothetical protein
VAAKGATALYVTTAYFYDGRFATGGAVSDRDVVCSEEVDVEVFVGERFDAATGEGAGCVELNQQSKRHGADSMGVTCFALITMSKTLI